MHDWAQQLENHYKILCSWAILKSYKLPKVVDNGFEPIHWKYECQGLHLSESIFRMLGAMMISHIYSGGANLLLADVGAGIGTSKLVMAGTSNLQHNWANINPQMLNVF